MTWFRFIGSELSYNNHSAHKKKGIVHIYDLRLCLYHLAMTIYQKIISQNLSLIPKGIEDACRRQANEAPEHRGTLWLGWESAANNHATSKATGIVTFNKLSFYLKWRSDLPAFTINLIHSCHCFILYPRHLKMPVGGKRTKTLSIEVLCDWAKRAQPTTTQRQRRRV